MSDLDYCKTMFKTAKVGFREVKKGDADFAPLFKRTATRLCVEHGYQAHFEMEFDESGMLVKAGQWDEM